LAPADPADRDPIRIDPELVGVIDQPAQAA